MLLHKQIHKKWKEKKKQQHQQNTPIRKQTKTRKTKLSTQTYPNTHKTIATNTQTNKTNTKTKPTNENKETKPKKQNISQNLIYSPKTYKWAWPTGLAQNQNKYKFINSQTEETQLPIPNQKTNSKRIESNRESPPQKITKTTTKHPNHILKTYRHNTSKLTKYINKLPHKKLQKTLHKNTHTHI